MIVLSRYWRCSQDVRSCTTAQTMDRCHLWAMLCDEESVWSYWTILSIAFFTASTVGFYHICNLTICLRVMGCDGDRLNEVSKHELLKLSRFKSKPMVQNRMCSNLCIANNRQSVLLLQQIFKQIRRRLRVFDKS